MRLLDILEKSGMTSLKIPPLFCKWSGLQKRPIKMPLGHCTLNCLQESPHSHCLLNTVMRKQHWTVSIRFLRLREKSLKNRDRIASTSQKLQLLFLTKSFVRLLQSGIERAWQVTLSRNRNASAFREELAALQVELRKYSRMLADIAEVEDLTDLEATE